MCSNSLREIYLEIIKSTQFTASEKLEIFGKLLDTEKEIEMEKEKEKEITNRSFFYNMRMLFTSNNENKEVA